MAQRGSDAPVTMNAALRARCEAVRKLLATAAVEEIDARYRVGVVIHAVKEAEGTYGEAAVERLAKVVGRDAASLYRYAAVAKAWPEPEMRALSRRANAFGEPLSWSHWVELARAPKTWRQWLELALLENWSARRLSKEIDAETHDGNEREIDDTTHGALVDVLRGVRRFDGEVADSFDALLDRLAREPPRRLSPDVRQLLSSVLELVDSAHLRTGRLAARVRLLAPEVAASSALPSAPPPGPRRPVPRENDVVSTL
jgi:hypothetical protein